MRTIYIAGPMRGFKGYNFAAFDAAAARWRKAGWRVKSPAEMDRAAGFDPATSIVDEAFMRETAMRDLMAIVYDCDAVAIPPEHLQNGSRGLRAELAVALWLNREVLIDNAWQNDEPE